MGTGRASKCIKLPGARRWTERDDKSLKQIRSKQLYERAFFFKRLAIGAADPKFAAKLQVLVDEYESAAARAKLEMEAPASGSSREETASAPQHRTG